MVLENAPQKEIVDPPKGNEILPKSSHKELSDLEQATTVAEKKQEVEDLKEEVQEQEPQPTYEEILEESYRQLLIRLFDESTAPWKTATQIIGLLEAQPKQKTVFQKARETLVLDLENKKQT